MFSQVFLFNGLKHSLIKSSLILLLIVYVKRLNNRERSANRF